MLRALDYAIDSVTEDHLGLDDFLVTESITLLGVARATLGLRLTWASDEIADERRRDHTLAQELIPPWYAGGRAKKKFLVWLRLKTAPKQKDAEFIAGR